MSDCDLRGGGGASDKTVQLAGFIHVEAEADGGALVINDETLTAARLNQSAHILFQALSRPRTLDDLVNIFAEAARCPVSDAVAPVAKLVEEITRLGWVEIVDDTAEVGRGAP